MAPLLLWSILVGSVAVAAADPQLHDLRAARRAAVRAAAQAKADEPGRFGLLVIPVQFADATFDLDKDTPEPPWTPHVLPALQRYVEIASQERTWLMIQLAPVITLPGERADYSDIGWQGHERSRAMARQALERARAAGAVFASSDLDADGEVDGVLLLHAGSGLENDPDGLIVPSQFYLADPVVHRGTVARSYAMAAERSTVGVVAHETGHLLGLEDRYDPHLDGSGETGPRGGLGRFSLMASGWLGSGDGADPALPDAYSRLLLGWVSTSDDGRLDTVVRLRQDGPAGPEYFLAERRTPGRFPDVDGGIPADLVVVYHVDERLADGEISAPDWPERHLRVELVEADGGREVARGETPGHRSDMFPSQGGTQDFSDATFPGSRTWDGQDTGVSMRVTGDPGEVTITDLADARWGDLRLRVETIGGQVVITPLVRYASAEDLPQEIACSLEVVDTTWGTFTGGTLAQDTLTAAPPGEPWAQRSGFGVAWQPAASVPPGATTLIRWRLGDGADGSGETTVVWDPGWLDLDLAGAWPGNWSIVSPTDDAGTTWHRWSGDGVAGLPAGLLLAATGADHQVASDWPDVRYANHAHARLLTPWQGTDLRWIALTHAVDLELLYPGRAVDGAGLIWVQASGNEVPAEPLDGWRGLVDARAQHALAGAPTFADGDSLDAQARPLWRRDILPVPDPAEHGPGPWRLRLDLASNAVWRGRGWFVRELSGHHDEPPVSAFPVALSGDQVTWTWPVQAEETTFRIERSADAGTTWQLASTLTVPPGAGPDHAVARSVLDFAPGVRHALRVVVLGAGPVASPMITIVTPAIVTLEPPRPNPFHEVCRVTVDAAGDREASLELYDLRGRRVRQWNSGGAPEVVTWDGTRADGQRVAAGVYIFRLRAQGRTLTRKVTWLP